MDKRQFQGKGGQLLVLIQEIEGLSSLTFHQTHISTILNNVHMLHQLITIMSIMCMCRAIRLPIRDTIRGTLTAAPRNQLFSSSISSSIPSSPKSLNSTSTFKGLDFTHSLYGFFSLSFFITSFSSSSSSFLILYLIVWPGSN